MSAARGPVLNLITLVLGISGLRAAEVSLSYTQEFDYSIPGIVGHPTATWTSIFEPNLHPSNPFSGTSPRLNEDFLLSGIMLQGGPTFFAWQGIAIEGVQFGTSI